MREAWIAPGDHWALLTAVVLCASGSILLERWTWIGARLTGPVIAVLAGMVLANGGVLPIPGEGRPVPVFAAIEDYLLPLAVPLFVMRLDLGRVRREAGRLFGAFHVAAAGTMLGALLAVALLHRLLPGAGRLSALMAASYIGGGVNFVAMKAEFQPDESLANAAIVADNVVMLLAFLLLMALPGIPALRKRFPAPPAGGGGGAAEFWRPKPISLADLAVSLGLAFLTAFLAVRLAGWFRGCALPAWLKGPLGSLYLQLTTLSLLLAAALKGRLGRVHGNEEVGTFLIYLFFVLLGVPADLGTVCRQSPLLFAFCGIIAAVNILSTLLLGRLLRLRLEEVVLAGVTTLGGPMNGAAIAVAKGWPGLVMPAFLVGVWGYVIGNYCGYAAGTVLIRFFGP